MIIKKLYEAVTGRPWTSGRSATSDYGPTIGARYAAELAGLSETELCALTPAEAIEYGEWVRNVRSEHTGQLEPLFTAIQR